MAPARDEREKSDPEVQRPAKELMHQREKQMGEPDPAELKQEIEDGQRENRRRDDERTAKKR